MKKCILFCLFIISESIPAQVYTMRNKDENIPLYILNEVEKWE